MGKLENIVRQSKSEIYDFPDILNSNIGLDIIGKDLQGNPLHAIKTWGYSKTNQKRRASLNISTWRGISFNAIHYYGKIMVQGVEMEYDNNPGVTTSLSDNPLSDYYYEFVLKRPLTRKELDEDSDRWDIHNEGDLVTGFESLEDLIALAKEVFKMRFRGEWEFFIEWPSGRCERIEKEEGVE